MSKTPQTMSIIIAKVSDGWGLSLMVRSFVHSSTPQKSVMLDLLVGWLIYGQPTSTKIVTQSE